MCLSLILLFVTTGCTAAAGLPPASNSARIVGGKLADIEAFPYQLSLQLGGVHICGAAILDENWAITAAHCVWDSRVEHLTLRAGSKHHSAGGQLRQVQQAVHHELYDSYTIDYDIAVLKVQTPFKLGRKVAAVRLPATNWRESAFTRANVTGWGYTEVLGLFQSPDFSNEDGLLRNVELTIQDRSRCDRIYQFLFTGRMLCATGDYYQDACMGDSGGPLVADGVLVGTVSWGYGCALQSYPGVYSRVSEMRDWIQNKTGL